MKAAVYEGKDRLTVHKVPTPQVDDESILVKVHACAVCGSDVKILHHGNNRVRPPQILGHESAGEVVDVGRNVTKFQVGDRVSIGAEVPCGTCAFCEAGIGNNCRMGYSMGYQFPGSFAEFVLLNKIVVNFGPVHRIPKMMPYDEAALAEPLATVLNAVEMASVRTGDTVAIIGAGPLGCMLIPVVKMHGATKVIVIQRTDTRLEMAKKLGADVTVAAAEFDPITKVLEETGGLGADVIFNANATPSTQEDALYMAKNRARICLFSGLPGGSTVTLDTNIIHYKELVIMGAHGSMPRHHRTAVELIAARAPDIRAYISHHFSLDDIKQAFATAEGQKGMRVIVNPWKLGE